MEKVVTKLITLDELLLHNLKGKIVCFPTDTVYGVGALVGDKEALDKIYQMKHREDDKPLAILCGNENQIIPYVQKMSIKSSELMRKYWPGALTIIFQKTDLLDNEITKNKPTVAFRMPNSKVALKILNTFGLMATTSVNISGEKELNSVDEIFEKFNGIIDYIVTDDEITLNLPSTIYDDQSGKVLRQGNVCIENE